MKIVYHLFINILLLLPFVAVAHGDEKQEQSKVTTKDYFTINASSDEFELVLRYKQVEAGKSTGLTVFLSDFETNSAIDTAEITVTSSEDSSIKFTVSKTEKGQYDIDGTFPKNQNYSLVFNIKSGSKSDLMLITPIEVGKKLPLLNIGKSETSTSDFKWWWIFLAFAIGCIVVYFIMQRKLNKLSLRGKVNLFLFILLMSVPFNTNNKVYAHNEPSFESKGGQSDEIEIGKESQFLFNVLTEKLIFSDYSSELTLNGIIKPSTNGHAEIVSPQNGMITKLTISIGQHVSKGQLLAEIIQVQSTADQLTLSSNKSNSIAEYESAKKDFDRLQSLKDYVAQKELQNAEIRYKNALSNKNLYEQLNSNLSVKYSLRSPIDGIIDNFNLTVGQQVEQGEVLMNVYDNKTLNVEVTVYSSDISKISNAAIFSIHNIDGNRSNVIAKMISLNKSFNPTNQSSTLILQIEKNIDFLPGQAVNINMMTKAKSAKMIVPNSAISIINGKSAVFVHHEPEVFKIIYLELGLQNSEGTEIKSGLNGDERLVVGGTYTVKSIYQNQ